MGYPYWDCSHSYTGNLGPNFADYSPLFIAGWTPLGICSNQFPVFGCLNCGVDWGGVKAFPGFYMTTNNTPGFLAAGAGTIVLSTNNGGGTSDILNLRLEQVNRDAMVNMTMFQSADETDPAPASDTEVAGRTFIANSGDRVPVVPIFHYGVDVNGADVQYPAGPDITYLATWETGATTTPEIAFAAQGLHGHTILAVPLPKLTTGNHSFTITATLPSGKTYTTPKMSLFAFAQTIYLTYGAFNAKTGSDDLPKFVPGNDVFGNNVDLKGGPQVMQLNIVTGRATGTVKLTIKDPTHYPGIAMNYPIPAAVDSNGLDPNPDMDFNLGADQLSLDIPIPKDHVIRIPLYVRDYGASATIEAIVPYRKKTYTATRRIPLDDNKNGLPDAGWVANGGVVITDTGQAADDFEIDPPATGLPVDTVLGDGLSAFEEYRGFFIGGAHLRLDPNKKDVFVAADPAVLTDPMAVIWLTKLPFRVYFPDFTEVSGQTNFARGLPLFATKAEVDPNRKSVPGARSRAHRALRLVWPPLKAADYFVSSTSTVIPVWQRGIHGITWNDGMTDIDLYNSPNNVPNIESPDLVQFVEVMPEADRNSGIGTDFSDPGGYHDASGTVVQPCGVAPPGAPCDDWDLVRGLIVPHVQPGGWAKLQTVVDTFLHPSDYYSQYSFTCGIPGLTEVVGRMSPSNMTLQPYRTMIHELGHNMQLSHVTDPLNDCHDLMYDNLMASPNRRTFLDIVPLTNDYSTANREHMRLWQP
jgi:hypothetical protein